jgi:hypothetical protein
MASNFSSTSLFVEDLDGDGDLDLLSGRGGSNSVRWLENTTGAGLVWVEHAVGLTINGPIAAVAGDLDRDGDQDALTVSGLLDQVIWWRNKGGQFALPTTDVVASASPIQGTADVLLLQIDAVHRGRAGDGDLEVTALELLFEEADGDPLSAGELAAIADAVRLYHDDGDGLFETDGSDAEIFSASPPYTLAAGLLTVPFADGAAAAQVVFGAGQRYFVAVDLASMASTAVPNTMRLSHLTESSSTAEMTATDIPLALEFQTNVVATITVARPEITVTPLTLAFGQRRPSDGASPAQVVAITNDGGDTLNIGSVALIGAASGEFQIVSDSGESTLAPGNTRTLSLTFDPTEAGAKAAQLRILSNDLDEATVDVDLAGTGVAEADWIFGDDLEGGDLGPWSASFPEP